VVLDHSCLPIAVAAGAQGEVKVAFGGSNYLVVWGDSRSGIAHIYGARVPPGGQVLDPNGILISAAVGRQDVPAVSFDGVNYLVVWSEDREPLNTFPPSLVGARVRSGGVV